jgi:hypothetical protein
MADLRKIDYDPFAEEAEDTEVEQYEGTTLTKVDYDPFAEPEKPEATIAAVLFGPKAPEMPERKLTPELEAEVARLEKSKGIATRLPKKVVQSMGQGVADIPRAVLAHVEQREADEDVEATEAYTSTSHETSPIDRTAPLQPDTANRVANTSDDLPEVQQFAAEFFKTNNRQPTNAELREARKGAYTNQIESAKAELKQAIAAFPEVDKETSGFLEDVIVGVFRHAPTMVLTGAAGGLAGGAKTVGAAAKTFPILLGQMVGQESEEFKQKGLDPKKVFQYSLMSGTAQAFLESGGNILALGKLGEFFKGGQKRIWDAAMRTVGQVMAAEGIEEGAQNVTSQFFKFMSEADGNTGDAAAQASERTLQYFSTAEGLKELGKSVAGGAIGGGFLGGGPVAVGTGVKVVKNVLNPTPEQQAVSANPLLKRSDKADLMDINEQEVTLTDGDVDKAESELTVETPEQLSTTTTKEQTQTQQQVAVDEAAEKKAQAEINAQRKEMIEAAESERIMEQERQAIAAEQEKEVARSQQRVSYVQSLADPDTLMNQADRMDAKPINEAHKALTIGEDNVKKLKGIEYDLKHAKELKEQPFEYQAVADGLAEHVQQRISDIEQAEAQKEVRDESRKFQEKQVKLEIAEEKAAAEEITKAPAKEPAKPAAKETAAPELKKVADKDVPSDLFTEFKKEPEEKKAEPTVKKPEGKMMRFNRRSFARRKAMGISEADSKKLDATYAKQQRIAAAKAKLSTTEKANIKPKDLQAAIRLETGTVLTGSSHFEIMGNLTDEQLEQIDFGSVNRGFSSKQDGFLSVDESTAKYGVTKSEQLKSEPDELTELRGYRLASKVDQAATAPKGLREGIEKRLTKRGKKLGLSKVKLIDSYEELPEIEQARAKAAGIKGLYVPYEETAYVLLPNHRNVADALVTVWHEAGGHHSLKKLADKANAGEDLATILNMVKKQYPKDIAMLQKAGYTNIDEAAEDVLIRHFEKHKNPTLVRRVTNLLRKIAKAMGFDPKMPDDKLVGILNSMRKSVLKPTKEMLSQASTNGARVPLSAAGKFRLDDAKWDTDQNREIFGTVNNRLSKELEIFERLFGPAKLAAMMPGKLVDGKRIPTRTITAYNLGTELFALKDSGMLKRYLDPRINGESLAEEQGLTGEDKESFLTELKELRSGPMYSELNKSGKPILSNMYSELNKSGKPILSSNGKAGMSADFLLSTCQPTTPCKECYAASSMIRPSNVRKAFRNTAHIMVDPKGWAKRVAAEAKRIPKTTLPFIRLLGSGDLTSTEQVDAFNELAKQADRPIQIFSRHHDNLRKLKGTKDAPFIKMGSIDADLYKHYGREYLKKNMDDHGIANAFLFTDESEMGMVEELHEDNALGLVLSADVKLHNKIQNELIKQTSCPCDAHERSYMASCRQCALSYQGCMMAFAAKGFDDTGTIHDLTIENADTIHPFTTFLNGVKEKAGMGKTAQAYSKVAQDIVAKNINLVKLYIRAFKAGDKKQIPLKDIRWPDDVVQVDNLAAAEEWIGNQERIKREAAKGTFDLPGGEIQAPVKYVEGKRIEAQGKFMIDPKQAAKKGNLIEVVSEDADATIDKKGTQPIRDRKIVQPAASDEVISEPKGKYSRDNIQDRVSPVEWEMIKRIGMRPTPFRDKVRNMLTNLSGRIGEALADPLYRLAQLQKQKGDVRGDEDSYMDFTMINNFMGIFKSFLEDGRLEWKNNWVRYNQADRKKGGLMNVFQNLGKDAELFLLRMQAKSAKEMLKRERENLFGLDAEGNMIDDQEMIDTLMAATDAAYESNGELWNQSEERLKEINKSVLDIMEGANIIDPETRHLWERETYMPFFRQMHDILDDEVKALHPAHSPKIRGIKKLKGSRKNVADPMSNLVNGYASAIHNSLKNVARIKAVRLLKHFDMAHETERTSGKGVVDIRIAGEVQHWEITDPLAIHAVMAIDDASNGLFSQILTAPKRWLTFAVTQNPAFRVANWLKDSFTASILEKEFVPIISSIEGLWHAARNTDVMKEYRSTGGSFEGAYHQRDILQNTERGLKKLRKRVKRGKRSFLNPLKYYELYNKMGEISENAARVGLYVKKRKAGQSAEQAGYAAKDLLDFHRSSKSKILRTFIHMVPFLNARIQGLYKVAREGTGLNVQRSKSHFASFYLYSAGLAVLSILNHWMNEDDERYKALTNDEKWYYYHFFDVPGIGHLRLPSPFELGTLAGKLPVELWKTLLKQRFPGDNTMWDFTKFAALDMFAFNPIPQWLKPWVHQYANKDTFTGAPIVPRGQEGIDPALQVSPRTSALSKGLGKAAEKIGLPSKAQSPRRIEKLFNDYFSYLSMAVFGGSNIAYNWITNAPDDPFLVDTIGYISGYSRFVRGEKPNRRNRYEEKFFDMLLEADTAHKSLNELKERKDRPAVREYKQTRKQLLQRKKHLTKVQDKLRKWRQRELMILRSTKSGKAKRAEIDELTVKRTELLRTTINNYLKSTEKK